MVALFLLVGAVFQFGPLQIPEAHAQTSIASGNFVKCTSSSCTNSINIGFQPKAVIFYWTNETTLEAFGGTAASTGFGFSDGTNHRSVTNFSIDNDTDSSSAESRVRSEAKAITIITGADATRISGRTAAG